MDQNHVITIDQAAEILNSSMNVSPKLLHKSAGKESCFIFRLPKKLVEANEESYLPKTISIGPYHNGNSNLQMMQEHKGRFLAQFFKRSGQPPNYFMNMMVAMEGKIRESYSESIDRFDTIKLATMMLLDGVFLIELFLTVSNLVNAQQDDPIFEMDWVAPNLMRDLLKIENQIPFFVLQKLFDASSTNINTGTLQALILEVFNYLVGRQPEVIKKYENQEGKHLLDIFRKTFIKNGNENNVASRAIVEESNDPFLKRIPPATKLVITGVKFKANLQAESFLDIEFQNGLLLIPQINMDDFYSSFFLNCVAFEQCYSHCSKHITTYLVFMGCLMNTSTDVALLSEKKIIENYFATDKEIAKFFKDVGKDVPFDIRNNYLIDLFRDMNSYCENGWHVGWAGFMHTYFSSPWAALSAFAALMLLLLAAIQTIFTVFPAHE